MNKLSVNVAKTKAMLFHMPQKQIHNPRLTIAGSNIEFIDNFNFLGITINKHLNRTKHMDTLSAKIAKTVGILNTLKHVLPTNILKMIYRGDWGPLGHGVHWDTPSSSKSLTYRAHEMQFPGCSGTPLVQEH